MVRYWFGIGTDDDPEVDSSADQSTWSSVVSELAEKGTVAVSPYDLVLEYDYWTYGMV